MDQATARMYKAELQTSTTGTTRSDQPIQPPGLKSRKRRRENEELLDKKFGTPYTLAELAAAPSRLMGIDEANVWPATRLKTHHQLDNTTLEDLSHINPIVVHQVLCPRSSSNHQRHQGATFYLDPPRLYQGDNKQSQLRGLHQVHDFRAFAEDQTSSSFVVMKKYDCEAYHGLPETLSKFQKITSAVIPAQVPSALRPFLVVLAEDLHEAQEMQENIELEFCSRDFKQAIRAAQRSHADLQRILRDWDSPKSLAAPYLQFYHARKQLKTTCDGLDPSSREQIQALLGYLDLYFGSEYEEADSLFQRGCFTQSHFHKLFAPGDIIAIKEDGYDIAVVAKSCPNSNALPITLECDAWTFDGAFHKTEKTVSIAVPPGYQKDEEIPISALSSIPLRFDETGLEQRLRQRGEFFWDCRHRRLVTSVAERRGYDIQVTNPRYMIDMDTYHLLHSGDTEAENQADIPPSSGGDLEPDEMDAQKPPPGPFVLLLPATIKAFRFHDKKWRTMAVEHLQEVEWNREAFRRLVLKDENKRHIRALVQNHVVNSRSADIIESKGNGLVILLHGPPGTGKTLTAESVAEFSERPLYRLTSGDIGTDHEMVEKSLEHIFYLGNIWKAVVLLDECEVFMEERVPSDLKRNALVSVFLRALEYYDGILILTSNRVGTFDEAFKSRMHLAMYYPPLEQDDRNEIWLNFFNRLAEEKDENKDLKIDIKDLMSNSVSLASNKLNGRQIRNAIETARKLALFEQDIFSSIHIRRTIKVIKEFDDYVEGTQGQTAEERAESTGIRRDPSRHTT